MAANHFLPHILVLPEDDANREMANGFLGDVGIRLPRQMQILPVAGGWHYVRDGFLRDHIQGMQRYSKRFFVLLIDFDFDEHRRAEIFNLVPPELFARVFVLGVQSEPEALKASAKLNFEQIGLALARDCREGTDNMWSHGLLRHNAEELSRVRETLAPLLF